MNHIKILARAMLLTALLAMGILLIFAVISPTLAQGTMIEMWDVQGRQVGTATITATSVYNHHSRMINLKVSGN